MGKVLQLILNVKKCVKQSKQKDNMIKTFKERNDLKTGLARNLTKQRPLAFNYTDY